MKQPVLSFTAVFVKAQHGFFGFLEELPGLHSQGHSVEEARAGLEHLAAIVFEEERILCAELLAGKDVVREEFRLDLPPAQGDRTRFATHFNSN